MLIQYVPFPLAGEVTGLKRVKECFLIRFLILFFFCYNDKRILIAQRTLTASLRDRHLIPE